MNPEQVPPPLEEIEALLEKASSLAFHEYVKAAPTIRARCTAPEFRAWAQEAEAIARHSFRSWEAAGEYLRVGAQVLELLPFPNFLPWAHLGRELAAASPDLSVAYFRASPQALPYLSPPQIQTWGSLGRALYKGTWHSGAVAVKYFEASPQLLPHMGLYELELLVHLLDHLVERSPTLALDCLELATSTLVRVERNEQGQLLNVTLAITKNLLSGAKRCLEAAPHALSRIHRGERHKFLSVAEKLAWMKPELALSLIGEGSQALFWVEGEHHSRILRLAEDILQRSGEAAVDFVRHCPDLLKRILPADLDHWCSEGLEAFREREESGIAYFRLESARAEEVLQSLSRGVELQQVSDVLRLYAKALTGMNVQILPLQDLKRRGIGWTSEAKPTTEGTNIFLPPLLQEYPTKRDNSEGYKVYTTHQAAHLEFGSFTFRFELLADLFPNLRLELESLLDRGGTFVVDMERFFDLFPQRRLTSDIFQIVEDLRVDQRTQWEYRGIRPALTRIQQSAGARRGALNALPLQQAFMEGLLQWSLNHDTPLVLPDTLHPHFRLGVRILQRVAMPEATVEDSAEATLRLYGIVNRIANVPSELVPEESWQTVALEEAEEHTITESFQLLFGVSDDAAGEFAALLATSSSSLEEATYEGLEQLDFRGDFKPELVQTLIRLKLKERQPDPDQPRAQLSSEALKELLSKLSETEVSELVAGDIIASSGMFVTNLLKEGGKKPTRMNDQPRPPVGQGELEEEPLESDEPSTFVYDEWDFRANDYRPMWCLVREKPVAEGEAEFYEETLRKHGQLAHQIRRQFELLRPELFKKIKKLPDGEDFDLDLVVEALVEKRAGVSPSEKLYWRRNKEERDVSVAFLLDMSASTDEDIVKEPVPEEEWNYDDDPRQYFLLALERQSAWKEQRKQRRRIIDLEKESIVLLTQALETVGDTYGVYGFSGYGRDDVEFFIIKDLEEEFSDVVKRRIDKIEPVRGTRMGPAIRHAIAKLEEHDARIKILFLLSDGRPQDYDYGRDRTEKEYAIHDTRMALLEARRRQIIPFCLTVDQDGHDWLGAMCADMGYEVVDDIESLPARLPTLYRMLTV